MTNPQVIRASEDRNPWPGIGPTLLLASDKRSRSSGRGDRLLLILAYGFVLLALCLMLSDFCRLMFGPNLDLLSGRPAVSGETVHQAHQARHLRKHG